MDYGFTVMAFSWEDKEVGWAYIEYSNLIYAFHSFSKFCYLRVYFVCYLYPTLGVFVITQL